jgi:hypothetical protein
VQYTAGQATKESKSSSSLELSTFPEGTNKGNEDEDSDELRCPSKPRDAVHAIQLCLLPAGAWGVIPVSAGHCPAKMGIARRLRSLCGRMRMRIRARRWPVSALPGIVCAPATGLVRGRVIRVITRLAGIRNNAAACRGERAVIRPSVLLTRVSGKKNNLGGTEEVPLSIISEHPIGLAERDEFLSRLWVFVHVRMVLLA